MFKILLHIKRKDINLLAEFILFAFLIKILPLIAFLCEKARQNSFSKIKIGSFIRADGHDGRCIDINLEDDLPSFTSPVAIDLVIFILTHLQDLDKENRKHLGFGMPYQGDFIPRGTGTKYKRIDKSKIINKKIGDLLTNLSAFVFPDNDNHLHIQVR